MIYRLTTLWYKFLAEWNVFLCYKAGHNWVYPYIDIPEGPYFYNIFMGRKFCRMCTKTANAWTFTYTTQEFYIERNSAWYKQWEQDHDNV